MPGSEEGPRYFCQSLEPPVEVPLVEELLVDESLVEEPLSVLLAVPPEEPLVEPLGVALEEPLEVPAKASVEAVRLGAEVFEDCEPEDLFEGVELLDNLDSGRLLWVE